MKNNTFGKRLKELRLEKGLSQQKLGELLGFCNQTVSFWENGNREPDLDTLVEIAHFFDRSGTDILQQTEHRLLFISQFRHLDIGVTG